jgi:hypothetical protein
MRDGQLPFVSGSQPLQQVQKHHRVDAAGHRNQEPRPAVKEPGSDQRYFVEQRPQLAPF